MKIKSIFFIMLFGVSGYAKTSSWDKVYEQHRSKLIGLAQDECVKKITKYVNDQYATGACQKYPDKIACAIDLAEDETTDRTDFAYALGICLTSTSENIKWASDISRDRLTNLSYVIAVIEKYGSDTVKCALNTDKNKIFFPYAISKCNGGQFFINCPRELYLDKLPNFKDCLAEKF